VLKAGFIGFGRMGMTHYSILNSHPSVQISAVCDQSSTMLNILNKYVGVEVFSNYQDMIDNTDLDFVIISTPSDSHSEIINLAIRNNLHIFTEKPFAMTSDDGRKSLEYLHGKHLVNQVGYVNRFNEVFMEVKRLVDNNVIGDVQNIRSEMYGATVLRDSGSSWRSRRKTGGGCMYEFASHCIDLAVYLVGEPDKVVGSFMQSIYSSNVEDLVSSNFIFNNDCTGNIMVNWSDETYRKPANMVTISGTRGKIIADKLSYKIYLKEPNPHNGFHEKWNTRYITDFAKGVRFYVRGNEFTRQLDYFVESIEQGREDNISSFEEALKTDIVMEKITKDAALSLGNRDHVARVSPLLPKNRGRLSMWQRLFKRSNKRNA
jgi:predicted dehydrogenase